MGKFKQWVSDAALRTGNTIATPVRRWGEIANALWNVERQGFSSVKNIKEVQIQTLNAVADNFLNFSKVEGKRYERLAKGTVNLASAVTRRPLMLAGAETLSTLNQWVRQPFKKLLYTPGKMFKWMRNATRIFSKKKGFDFAKYDTHETKWDTWINQIREKRIGFFGKWSSSGEKPEEPKKEEKKPEETKKEIKPESKKDEPKPVEAKKEIKPEPKKPDQPSDKKPDSTPPSKPVSPSENPGTIKDIEKQRKEESEKKDAAENNKRQRKNLDPKFKVQYGKEFKKMLNNKPTKEWVIERGEKNNKWENIEEIMTTIKKEYPEFAGYIEDEVLKKAA